MAIRLVFAGAMRACNVLCWETLAVWPLYIPLTAGEQTVVLLPRSPSPSKRYFPIPLDSLEEEYRIRSADDGKLFREEFNVSESLCGRGRERRGPTCLTEIFVPQAQKIAIKCYVSGTLGFILTSRGLGFCLYSRCRVTTTTGPLRRRAESTTERKTDTPTFYHVSEDLSGQQAVWM